MKALSKHDPNQTIVEIAYPTRHLPLLGLLGGDALVQSFSLHSTVRDVYVCFFRG